ncbi:hypothetical protein LZ30DRAFT_670166 [Colletotrichum cereale]|nr:hypothetical protein LZ30DRAFT_670166 [Colletotrichum cereale]
MSSHRIGQLEQKLSDFERDIRKQEDLACGYQKELNALREQFVDIVAAKSYQQQIADSNKASDDAILEIWKRMAYNINTMATSLLTHCPPKEYLQIQCRHYPSPLLLWMSHQYHLFEDENTRSAIVEHYIWRSIDCRMFGNSRYEEQSAAWGGVSGIQVWFLCRELSLRLSIQDVPDFCSWRSQGAAIVESLVGRQDQELTMLITADHCSLSLLLSPSDDSRARILYEELSNIYKDALDLHAIFMKSKAIFCIEWVQLTGLCQGEVPYDPNLMEAEAWTWVPDVNSVVISDISPGLRKFGTADGASFDQQILLVKPKVICN